MLDSDDVSPTLPLSSSPQLTQTQLVLIDAGCEKSMYASDITRTFPVSGKFTGPQRDLYEAVLSAQKECVKRCKVEDGVSLNDLHRASEPLPAVPCGTLAGD